MKRKEKICPECGSNKVVGVILYGFPAWLCEVCHMVFGFWSDLMLFRSDPEEELFTYCYKKKRYTKALKEWRKWCKGKKNV